MTELENNNDLAEQFKNATDYVASTSSDSNTISDELKLQFYGLYKRATVGKCCDHGTKPWAWELEASAKYDAWNKCEYLTVSQSMQRYINLLEETKKSVN